MMKTNPKQEQLKAKILLDSHSTLHLKVEEESALSEKELNTLLKEADLRQIETHAKAIWCHLGFANLNYMQFLLQKGFQIHRAVGQSVSLYKWCSKAVKDNIPPFSKFYIGCGAAIIKDDKIFLVKQKSGDRKGYYGIPGGRSDAGELISQATQRQLFEETGLKGKFEYILYFRELPKSLWGASDVYFVSLMSVQDKEFDQIKLCENEISEYKWVKLSEFEQFCQQNCFGTQTHVGKHIGELYRNGYDFKKKSNVAFEKIYRKGSQNMMTEHIITGLDILGYLKGTQQGNQ